MFKMADRTVRARVPKDGEEGPGLTTCAQFACRLIDWGRNPTCKVFAKLERGWPCVARQLDMDIDMWQALTFDSEWGAARVAEALSVCRKKLQSQQLRKWQPLVQVDSSGGCLSAIVAGE